MNVLDVPALAVALPGEGPERLRSRQRYHRTGFTVFSKA